MLFASIESPSICVYHIFRESIVCCIGVTVDCRLPPHENNAALLAKPTNRLKMFRFAFDKMIMFLFCVAKVVLFQEIDKNTLLLFLEVEVFSRKVTIVLIRGYFCCIRRYSFHSFCLLRCEKVIRKFG